MPPWTRLRGYLRGSLGEAVTLFLTDRVGPERFIVCHLSRSFSIRFFSVAMIVSSCSTMDQRQQFPNCVCLAHMVAHLTISFPEPPLPWTRVTEALSGRDLKCETVNMSFGRLFEFKILDWRLLFYESVLVRLSGISVERRLKN